ncbi:predicted protein [Postia placenta Mad-698-R]|nr:predicted protein [Postia placenta Mad-698-R]
MHGLSVIKQSFRKSWRRSRDISITAPPVRSAILPRLPVEIWLMIIDELGAEGEYDALIACARASQGLLWEVEKTAKRTPAEVARINLAPRWRGPFTVHIVGGIQRGRRLPIPHLATFASRLAAKWTSLSKLEIESAEWGLDLHSSLHNFSNFTMTCLHLCDVAFPTVVTFWHVACALPHLTWLQLCGVEIIETSIDAQTLSALCLLPASKLWRIDLLPPPTKPVAGRPQSLARHSAQLLAQSMPLLKTPPWRNVRNLILWDVTLSTPAAFARLLGALPALETLAINGSCSFPEHGFNPSDVPLRPDMLSKLTTVELGKSFSLFSDPQSVCDLVDLLIHSGASRHLEAIMVWLSQSLRVTTSVDAALNRLVMHTGQSLKKLILRVLPRESLWMYIGASTHAGLNTANTHLERLVYSVGITHSDVSTIAPVAELLHQVASAHISHISLIFCITDEADLAKLWSRLPQLDAALSQTIFHNLRLFWIGFRRVNEFTESPIPTRRRIQPHLAASRDVPVLACCFDPDIRSKPILGVGMPDYA